MWFLWKHYVGFSPSDPSISMPFQPIPGTWRSWENKFAQLANPIRNASQASLVQVAFEQHGSNIWIWIRQSTPWERPRAAPSGSTQRVGGYFPYQKRLQNQYQGLASHAGGGTFRSKEHGQNWRGWLMTTRHDTPSCWSGDFMCMWARLFLKTTSDMSSFVTTGTGQILRRPLNILVNWKPRGQSLKYLYDKQLTCFHL